MKLLHLITIICLAALAPSCTVTGGTGPKADVVTATLGIVMSGVIASQSTPEKQESLARNIKSGADAVAALTAEDATGAEITSVILQYAGKSDPKLVAGAVAAGKLFDVYKSSHPDSPAAWKTILAGLATELSTSAAPFIPAPVA